MLMNEEELIEYSISVCKVLDYQNFPHKYKENIKFCASLYLKVLNKPLKSAF